MIAPLALAALLAATDADPVPGGAEAASQEDGRGNLAAAPRGARLFETVEVAAEAGLWMPAGNLGNIVDPAPLFGLRLTSSYHGAFRAFGSLSGTRLDGPPRAPSLLYAAGAAGLEWRGGPALLPFLPSAGLALALNYVRALEVGSDPETYLFLEDGESEFGMQASLRWSLPLGEKLRLEAGGRWEVTFTSPEYGQAAAWTMGGAWTW